MESGTDLLVATGSKDRTLRLWMVIRMRTTLNLGLYALPNNDAPSLINVLSI